MNAWKKLFLPIGLLFITPAVNSEPIPADVKRRITLSLGYNEDFNSNEGMKHLPLTTIQAYSWVFDQLTKITEGEKSRAALIVVDFLLHLPYLGGELNESDSMWLFKEKWWPYVPAYHEFGHARGMRAFIKNKGIDYDVQIFGQAISERPSVLWYYFDSAYYLGLISDASVNGSFTPPKLTHRLPIVAGGLNNESRIASEIADRIYRFNGHIAYFGPYLRCKTGSISYTAKQKSGWVAPSGSDIVYIVNYYKTYHPNFNIDTLQYGGFASLLLSSTTYSFIKGVWDFVKTGDTTVRTFTWNGIRLPDVNFYYTRNGLSLEVVTGYQLNPNLWFNLGIETVYYPKRSVEFTPGVRYVLPTTIYGTFDFECGLVLNGFGHVSGHVGVEWTDPVNPLTLHAKLIHHNANTYVGERNIPKALDSNHDFEVVIAASFNY